ncbi:MAG: PAS domain-containing protein [Actinobacteria bacterium]|nr:PAS domain-containing protein [Actinomycetota bacterium]
MGSDRPDGGSEEPRDLGALGIEQVLERISDAFVALDTEWRYTYVNERAAQMFGRTREALVGTHIWTEFPEGIDQPFYKAYYRAVETQQPSQIEEYYPPYDRWFENRIYPSEGGLAIFFQDVTERKRAELALLDSESRFRAVFERSMIGQVLRLRHRITVAIPPRPCYASPHGRRGRHQTAIRASASVPR